ncbi:MAG: DUF2946 family protein [Pseudomonadota bacterium]
MLGCDTKWRTGVLVALMLVLQVVGLATAATHAAGPTDVQALICTPTGKVDAALEAALVDLVTDGDRDDSHQSHDHCPLCTLSADAVAPAPIIAIGSDYFIEPATLPTRVDRTSVGATGPPLGCRAPPFFL